MMESALAKFRDTFRLGSVLKVNVYDRQLELIYSGQFTREQETQAQQLLKDCSLLFDVNNTSYFLKNH